MIGKQVKGRGFCGCLSYVLGKEGAAILDGNLMGDEPQDLARQFRLFCRLNPRVERVVYHASLSVAASEPLDNDTWRAIANDYLREMGFTDVPYIVVKHTDTDHHHIHIVAGRVRADGSCVSDKFDYYRSQKAIRAIEQRYGLSSPQPWRIPVYQPQAEEQQAFSTVQKAIDRLAQSSPSPIKLVQSLHNEDIHVRLHSSRQSERIRGISYEYLGCRFTGTQLGATYTWNGLVKKRGLACPPMEQGELAQQQNCANSKALAAQTPPVRDLEFQQQQQQWLEEIAPVADELLNRFKKPKLKGRNYRIYRFREVVLLKRVADDSTVFRASKTEDWEALKPSNIREADFNNFQILAQQLATQTEAKVKAHDLYDNEIHVTFTKRR